MSSALCVEEGVCRDVEVRRSYPSQGEEFEHVHFYNMDHSVITGH
jgi:hypothetical protein